MIRLVRFQEPDEALFAFYNTVRDEFLRFNGVQAFVDFTAIADCYKNPSKHDSCYIALERLKRLLEEGK